MSARTRIYLPLLLGGCLLLGGSAALAKANGGKKLKTLSFVKLGGSTFQSLKNLFGFCSAPTPAECMDPSYVASSCGQAAAAALSNPTASCRLSCDLDALTDEQCSDAAFLNSLCGRLERERAKIEWPLGDLANHPSVCVRYVDDRARTSQAQPAATAIPEITDMTEVIVPTTTTSQPSLSELPPPGSRVVTRRKPFDGTVSASGFSSTYWGSTVRDQVGSSNPNQVINTSLLIQQTRATWEANGNRVDTCREYVFEKYNDYSKFKDQIRGLKNDYRAIFDVAYAPARPTPPDYAIATKGRLGMPLAQRDGTPLVPQIKFPTRPQPKNTYFALPVLEPAAREGVLEGWAATPEAERPPRPFSFALFLFDEDLATRLYTGQTEHTHTEDWDWHAERSEALSGYLDEELYAFDKPKERFAFLLARRGNLMKAYANVWREATEELITGLPPEFYFPNPAEEVINYGDVLNDPISSTFERQGDRAQEHFTAEGFTAPSLGSVVNFSALQVATMDFGNVSPISGQAPGGALTPMSGSAQSGLGSLSSFQIGALASAAQGGQYVGPQILHHVPFINRDCPSSDTPGFTMREVLDCIAASVREVDAAIEAALVHAREIGCLDLDADNPCDWSPKLFAQRVEDPYTEYREPDYQRCQEYTAGDLSPLVNPDFTYDLDGNGPMAPLLTKLGTEECVAIDYRASPTLVERYYKCMDRWRQNLIWALSNQLGAQVVNPLPPHDIKIERSSSDSDRLGDDDFGVEVNYVGTWAIRGIPSDAQNPNYCEVDPYVEGSFEVEATFLGIDFSLLNASGLITAQPETPSHALLEIVGQEIISEEAYLSVDGYDGFDEDLTERQTFFEVSVTVVIVYVPVSIKGGVSGFIGAAVSAGMGVPKDANGNCEQGSLGASFSFGPRAGVEGFASVSIDAYIIEAGIKITLVVIDFMLPFKVGATLRGLQQGEFLDSTLTLETGLDIALSILAGRVSVFVEFCFIFCESFEEDLFAWDGLRFQTNLFTVGFEVPLRPIIEYAASLDD